VLASQHLAAATIIGYGPEPLVRPLAAAFRDTTAASEVDLLEFLRVEGGRYWSYTCGNETSCPAAGTPLDAGSQATASAALAGNGTQVLADCAALAASIAPLGGIAAESMLEATRRAEQHVVQLLAKVRKSARLGAARHVIATEGLSAVAVMIAAYRGGGRYTSDYQLAWLTVALKDLRVRDDAWARMDPRHRDAHRRLWTDVVRRAQPGHVAAPASLLAFVAWQAGNGALANVALDRALADDPRYSMAELLRRVISAGAPPSMAKLPMTPEEVAASYDDLETEDDQEDDEDEHEDEEEAAADIPGDGTRCPCGASTGGEHIDDRTAAREPVGASA